VSSIFVDDQDKALAFYTEKLGFVKKTEVPLGGTMRWLTVVSPDDRDGTELVLEPDSHPAVGPFKRALVQDGIPFASFGVDDVRAEYERLRAEGVVFAQPPVAMGPVTTAVLDDTCGNLIQLAQKG
jgi:catechol 2,3-dioxygenase-like lactoylglutathione lyase family enzyme